MKKNIMLISIAAIVLLAVIASAGCVDYYSPSISYQDAKNSHDIRYFSFMGNGYEELYNNMDYYSTKLIDMDGKTIQIISDGHPQKCQGLISPMYSGEYVYFYYDGSCGVLKENKMYKMIVQPRGFVTYENMAGYKVTVPAITIVKIELYFS